MQGDQPTQAATLRLVGTTPLLHIPMNPPAISLHPSFIPNPQSLFVHLKETVRWDERMKARKTASFGVPYDYSQLSYDPAPMPEVLDALCSRIHSLLGFRPNNCLLNYYPDGNASMGFHSDSSEQLAPDTGVVIVSLGGERAISYQAKTDRAIHFSYVLTNGSLLYMSDQIQHDWLHAIPKQVGADERISLTFRSITPAL